MLHSAVGVFNDQRFIVDYRFTTTMLSRNLELFNSGIVQQQQTPTTLPDLSHLKSPSIDRSAAGMTILRIVNISFWILAAATLPLSLFSLAMRLACWSFLNRDWMIHLIATYPFKSLHTCRRRKNKHIRSL